MTAAGVRRTGRVSMGSATGSSALKTLKRPGSAELVRSHLSL